MRSSSDFKFDLTFAFVIFAFVIIVITTYTSIYMFTRLTTQEFEDKIKILAENIYLNYKAKENIIKNTTLALAKNDIFNSTFTPNDAILKSVFKTMLYANSDLIQIDYFNNYGKNIISCKKINGTIYCGSSDKFLKVENFKSDKNIFFQEKFKNNAIEFIAFAPVKIEKFPGFIEVKALIKGLFRNNNFYHFIIIDKNGNILLSDVYKYKNLNDIFSYFLNKKILKTNEGFVTEGIYIKKLNDKIKMIFIQNKNLINKTNEISKTLTVIMIILSIFFAIPLGMFFSRPLYTFYQELDRRVKEEIEKRQEKEQLLIAQSKLAALGEMLGNIAHQWRHPLTRLSLLIQNFELAASKNRLTPEFIEKFKTQANAQIQYMSQTIDDFTNFFKKDTKKVEFCPKEIIEEALKLIEGRLKQNRVEVKLDFIKTESIVGYKSEFSQVILNILNNAIDVLKERDIKNRKIWIRINGKKIEIEDNAGGIPEEIKDKIFEPYFTTKFQSQGTGIGLYMSKVIINQHFNGELYAYNSKNGAVFVIDLSKKSTF